MASWWHCWERPCRAVLVRGLLHCSLVVYTSAKSPGQGKKQEEKETGQASISAGCRSLCACRGVPSRLLNQRCDSPGTL